MNFLAHLFLSGDEPEAMTGNLMADFIKGAGIHTLPPGVADGVRLHRAIDAYTDSHPVTRRSVERIRGRWGRVSGILMDVYYDHILARDWERYSAEPLRAWLDRSYDLFLPCASLLPETYAGKARCLVSEDLLMSYAAAEGIASALARLSRRLCNGRFTLEKALPDLLALDPDLSADFHEFFPGLQQFAQDFRTRDSCPRSEEVDEVDPVEQVDALDRVETTEPKRGA